MAETGEKWVKNVLLSQGYNINTIGREDIFAEKEKLGVVVEEKDWKDKVKVFKNKIYSQGIDGKWYYQKRNQVVRYGYEIKKMDMEDKKYRHIICVFVFSNLFGPLVQPIFFRKFGTIFVVHKNYFPVWLKSLERTYMGELVVDAPSMYMGGK